MERAALSEVLRPWLGQGPEAGSSHPTLISEVKPKRFMAALAAAVAGESDIFLCNPAWGVAEQVQLRALLTLNPATGDLNPESERGAHPSPPRAGDYAPHQSGQVAPKRVGHEGGWLMIPTGGTGGRLKFARHDAGTLAAAVHGFTRHFALPQVNAVGVLPLYHVSGLMAWLRCAMTGGEYRPLDWKAVEGGNLPELPSKAAGWTLSLVPTQLERLLRDKAAARWLGRFRIIFLGGGPAWPDLLQRAGALRLPLSLGYGMTESAAMLTAQQPEEFLAGAHHCGSALPHATLKIGPDGVIALGGGSIFHGYYPDWRWAGDFQTADLGRLDGQGKLHLLGRSDAVIITGGEKVDPAEIEAILRGSGEFPDIAVLGLPDAEWGQIVVAAYPATARPDFAKLAGFTEQLAAAKRPKRYLPVSNWPVNESGKVNRAHLLALLKNAGTET